MSQYVLELYAYSRPPLQLSLSKEKVLLPIEERVSLSWECVYADLGYSAHIIGDATESITSVNVFVNDIYIPCTYENGHIAFSDKRKRLFLSCNGFVELTIILDLLSGEELILYSPLLSVMVRRGMMNDTVKAMVEYIDRYQAELLFQGKAHSKDWAGTQEDGVSSLEFHLLLAEEIASLYENSYGYFRANSRFSVIQRDVVDQFEKLQYLAPRTLQYIACNPQLLKQVNSSVGIHVRGRVFHPTHTLTTQSVYSTDIYENQVIVGFTKKILLDLLGIEQEVSRLLGSIPNYEDEQGDYIHSTSFIFVNTKRTLENYLIRLRHLTQCYERIFSMYQDILRTSETPLSTPPRPSATFLAVPQYNKLFVQIHRWYSHGIYSFDSERYMLSFLQVSELYENYILIKLINCLKESGHALSGKSKCAYPVHLRWKYKNTRCYNTFVFSRSNAKITLYYQPVIFDTDKSFVNGIELYRNNTISLGSNTEGERRGRYYVPDFIFKVEREDETAYILCDAKFSTLSTIKSYQLQDLVYKYLFSISATQPLTIVSGLAIIYGLCADEEDMKTIYDKQFQNQAIRPFLETIPMAENSDASKHVGYLLNLLRLI